MSSEEATQFPKEYEEKRERILETLKKGLNFPSTQKETLEETPAPPKLNPGVPVKNSSNPPDIPPKKEKDSDVALKDPSVQNFMKTFKAQIISVESLKKNTP